MKKQRSTIFTFLVSITLLALPGLAIAQPSATRAQLSPPNVTDPIEESKYPTINAQNVDLVGHMGGFSVAVFVQGNYAYIGEGLRLTILDISNPATPNVIGKTAPLAGLIWDIYVSGSIAYVASGSGGLQVIDISSPTAPTRVGAVATLQDARGVYVSGNTVYVADGQAGLRVIDASNPANPMEIGGYDTPVYVSGVYVVGTTAYVADGDGGLRIVDVSNPVSPAEVGYYDTLGEALGVYVSDSIAYIAVRQTGLELVDVSDPISPTRLGVADVSGYNSNVYVSGNSAYLASGNGGFWVIDVSDPTDPSVEGSYDSLPGGVWDVYISSNIAYLADGDGGLQVADVNDPTNPAPLGFYDAPGPVLGIYVSGNTAYLADGDDSLRVADVGNPAAPVALGKTTPFTQVFEDLYASGGLAYMARGFGGLRIVDVSTPANPIEVGDFQTSGYAHGVYTSGNTAYLAAGDAGLRVIDVSNPANPTEIGSYTTPSSANGVYVSGSIAYVASSFDGLRVIDISTPSTPVEIGSVELAGDSSATVDVHISSNAAFVVDLNTGLHIIDVTNPTNPIEVGSIDTPGSAETVSVSGSLAFVADGATPVANASLRVIDVSDPAHPTLVGSYELPGTTISDVYASGDTVFVAGGAAGLLVLRYAVGPTYAVSGRVLDVDSNPIPGVTISDGVGHTATTGPDGAYVLSGLPASTYTITPSKSGYDFSPPSRTVSVPPNATGVDFVGTLQIYSISGRVADANGVPVPDVTISDDVGHTTITDNNGNYTLDNLPAGTYTIIPSTLPPDDYIFLPGWHIITGPPDATGVDFTARPLPAPTDPSPPPKAGIPYIESVKSTYSGVFLNSISLQNTYDAAVDWNGMADGNGNPDEVKLNLNGNGVVEPGGPAGASHIYDMGTDFCAFPNANQMIVIATNAESISSYPYFLSPEVVDPAPWFVLFEPSVTLPISPLSPHDNIVEFQTGFKFPSQPIPGQVDVPIPLIKGKWGVEWQPLIVDGSFKSNGDTSVSAGGKLELMAAGRGGGVKLKGSGTLDKYADVEELTGQVTGYLIFKFPKTPLPAPVSFISVEPRIKPSIRGQFGLEPVDDEAYEVIKGTMLGWSDLQLDLSAAVEAEFAFTGFDDLKAGVGAEPFGVIVFRPVSVKQFGGTVYIWAEVDLMFYTRDWKLSYTWSYPPEEGALATTSPVLVETSGWHPLKRDYLSKNYAHFVANTASGITALDVTGPTTETLILSNIFPSAAPALDVRGDRSTLVWVHDDSTKPISQSLEIMASQWDGLAWTSPVNITADTATDVQPTVAYATNGRPMAIWTTIPDASAATDPHEVVPFMEIAYSAYNGVSQTWDAPAKLTNNTYMDFLPRLAPDPSGQLVAMWLADPDNVFPISRDEEIPLSEDLYYATWDGATWSDPILALSGLATRDTPSFAPGNPLVAAWSADTDDNPVTRSDQDIFYTTWNGATWTIPQPLTNDEFPDIEPHVLRDNNGVAHLAWIKENITVTLDLTETTSVDRVYFATFDGSQWDPPSIAVEAPGITGLDLALDSQGNLVLIWQESGANGVDMFYAIRDDQHDLWGAPKQITDDHPVDSDFTAAIDGQDHIWASYLKHSVVVSDTIVNIGGGKTVTVPVPTLTRADLYVLEHVIFNDLTVTADDVVLSTPNPSPGSTVTISATVRNSGDLAVEGLVIGFYDGDPDLSGTMIATRTVEDALGAGMTATVSAEWTVPSVQESHTLVVRADPANAVEEWNEDNDAQIVTVVPDLKVAEMPVMYVPDQEEVVVGAVISNAGTINASTTAVEFRQGAVTGTLLSTMNLDPLPAGQSRMLTTTWSVSAVSAGSHYVHAIVDPANTVKEDHEDNNTDRTLVKVLPDLVLRSTGVLTGYNGGNLLVSVWVFNEGQRDANGVTLGLYNRLPTSSVTPLASAILDIPAGEHRVATLNLGNYSLSGFYVGVGISGEVEDRDTSNNILLVGQAPATGNIYLPIIFKAAVPPAPDLLVTNLVATSHAVTVTIKNQGDVPTSVPFWVDVYFNPSVTPGLNQPWDTIASHGVVWGVTASIPADGTLTLTTSDADPYYFRDYSSPAPLPVGANVYAMADSVDFSTPYGAVRESNENNNLLGPVTSTAAAGEISPSSQSQPRSAEGLPPRR